MVTHQNNGRMKKLFILPLFFILFSLSVFAAEYPFVGSNDYIQGSGFFNTGLNPNDITYASRLVSVPIGVPLVADLDGDGRKEVLVQDSQTLTLYQNKTLGIILNAAFTLNVSPSFTQKYIYDIDGDGKKEVIVMNDFTSQIDILEFNGTDFYRQATLAINSTITDGQSRYEIACGATEECVIVNQFRSETGGTSKAIRATIFNSTDIRSNVLVSTPTNFACFPQIRSLEVSAASSNVNDYIFTMVENGAGGTAETLRLYQAVVTTSGSSKSISGSLLGSETMANVQSITIGNCYSDADGTPTPIDMGKSITAAIAYNFHTTAGNEIVFGYMDSTTEYILRMFSAAGVELDRFPNLLQGSVDGTLLSNPFRADALASDGQTDFCVLGGTPAGSTGSGGMSEINVLCGSKLHSATCPLSPVECDHAEFDMQVSYNISQDSNFQNASGQHIITHTAQMSQDTTSEGGSSLTGANLDELVTSYGILEFHYDDDNTMNLIFAQPKGDASVISSDVEGNTHDDLLILTETNLFYADDGFTNQKGKVVSVQTAPCINNPIRENSTISVTATINDESRAVGVESDSVSARIVAYAGDTNEYTSPFTANTTAGASGTPFALTFNGNLSANNAILLIVGRDTGSPLENDTISRTFTITPTAVNVPSCTETFALTPTAGTESVTNTSRLPTSNNTISNAMAGINEQFGLGSTTIWLILMVVVAIGIWITGHNEHAGSLIVAGVIGFVEFLLFIIGAYLGFISAGLIVIIVIIAVAIIGFMFIRPIIGGGGT